VGVVMLPQFMGTQSKDSEENDRAVFNLLFIGSTLPMAVSSIYKEALFNSTDIDVNFLQVWVAFWQAAFGLCLIPLNTLSFLGPQALTWSELPDSIYNGAKCLIGQNTLVLPHCYIPPHVVQGLSPCDECGQSWLPVCLYLFFNCNYNIFIMLVIKHGSASLMYIIMTLRLPLVQIAFSVPMVNNPPDHFQWPTLLGLIMILVGLIAYRWPTGEQPQEGEEDVAVVFIGNQNMPATIRRKIMAHMTKSSQQIRSNLYSKLGVIHSPVTPYSQRTPNSSRPSSKARSTRSPAPSGNALKPPSGHVVKIGGSNEGDLDRPRTRSH